MLLVCWRENRGWERRMCLRVVSGPDLRCFCGEASRLSVSATIGQSLPCVVLALEQVQVERQSRLQFSRLNSAETRCSHASCEGLVVQDKSSAVDSASSLHALYALRVNPPRKPSLFLFFKSNPHWHSYSTFYLHHQDVFNG